MVGHQLTEKPPNNSINESVVPDAKEVTSVSNYEDKTRTPEYN